MMRQFFRTLPIELEEAARIDGASRLGVLLQIVLPLSRAGPRDARRDHVHVDLERLPVAPDHDLLRGQDDRCSSASRRSRARTRRTRPLLMAANVMSMLPILLVFFLAQRWFVRGIATSGLK